MPGPRRRSSKVPEPVPVTLDDLTISTDGVDCDVLLKEWRWLVDERYTTVLLSAIGDAFLEAPGGSIYWLQAGTGRLDKVADSLDEFHQLMTQPDQVREWFAPRLVGILKAQGIELGPGQCYGYMNPPALGGRMEPTNLEPADLYVHFDILGQITYQCKDVSPKTRTASREAHPSD
jgi:hypothetical protein